MTAAAEVTYEGYEDIEPPQTAIAPTSPLVEQHNTAPHGAVFLLNIMGVEGVPHPFILSSRQEAVREQRDALSDVRLREPMGRVTRHALAYVLFWRDQARARAGLEQALENLDAAREALLAAQMGPGDYKPSEWHLPQRSRAFQAHPLRQEIADGMKGLLRPLMDRVVARVSAPRSMPA